MPKAESPELIKKQIQSHKPEFKLETKEYHVTELLGCALASSSLRIISTSEDFFFEPGLYFNQFALGIYKLKVLEIEEPFFFLSKLDKKKLNTNFFIFILFVLQK